MKYMLQIKLGTLADILATTVHACTNVSNIDIHKSKLSGLEAELWTVSLPPWNGLIHPSNGSLTLVRNDETVSVREHFILDVPSLDCTRTICHKGNKIKDNTSYAHIRDISDFRMTNYLQFETCCCLQEVDLVQFSFTFLFPRHGITCNRVM